MATSILDLNRSSYLRLGGTPKRPGVDYLSAKYKNIKFTLTPKQSYTVSNSDMANAPGIAFSVYGDADYWWVICLFNGILNPITDFKPGMVLQLPTLADINAFLSSQDTSPEDAQVTI
jgi:hypothetical protein